MIDVPKLRKLHAMTSSPNPHEAAVAWGKVDALLRAGGKGRQDLKGLLSGSADKPVDPAPQYANPFAGFDDWMEGKEPGYRASRAKEQAEKRQRETDELAALMRRYGSLERLEADNSMQAAVEAAVAPFKRAVRKEYANGGFETDSLDGWTDVYDPNGLPERVREAIKHALPLPATVTAAKAEYDAWEARDRELGLVRGDLSEAWLSLACQVRSDIVRNLFERDLRARDLGEVLLRQRYYVSRDMSEPENEKAILADLEALAAAETPLPFASIIPPEVDGLDAPHGMPKEQAIGWARGWNACRDALLRAPACAARTGDQRPYEGPG